MRFAFITEGISDCTVMVVAILHSCIRTRTWWLHQMGTFSASLNSPHKCQWRGALRFSLICAWTNGWVNNRETGDLRRHRAHNDVIVMNCYDITVCKHWHQYDKTIFVTHNSNNSTLSLRWRHNDHAGVSNHQPHGCLLNRLFRRNSKKTSKLHVTGFVWEIHRGPVNFPHKGPVTRKMFPFDDVIMIPLQSREY